MGKKARLFDDLTPQEAIWKALALAAEPDADDVWIGKQLIERMGPLAGRLQPIHTKEVGSADTLCGEDATVLGPVPTCGVCADREREDRIAFSTGRWAAGFEMGRETAVIEDLQLEWHPDGRVRFEFPVVTG